MLVLVPLLVWGLPGVGVGSEDCREIYDGIGKPAPRTPHPATELCRMGYFLSYNHTTKVADWVMERLTAAALSGPANRRHSRFSTDPELENIPAPQLSDYRGSGYDRGHMAPAGDMKWSQQAMDQSFFLANIAPQVGVGFNRRIWKALEERVRDLVLIEADLVVITGPVFFDYEPRIGAGVVVPDAFFKIIYAPGDQRAWAFLIPNQNWGAADLSLFAVSVRQLEDLTGFDFFNALAPANEAALEATTRPLWP